MSNNNDAPKEIIQELPSSAWGKFLETKGFNLKKNANDLFYSPNRPNGFQMQQVRNNLKFSTRYTKVGSALGKGAGGIFAAANITEGIVTKGWKQGLLSNGTGVLTGMGAASGIVWVAGSIGVATVGWPAIAVATGATLIGGAVGYGTTKAIDNVSSKVKNKDNALEKINTLKNFSKLQSAKLDDIKSPNVSGIVDNTELLIQYPTPTINTSSTNWMSQIGNIFSSMANILNTGVGIFSGINSATSNKSPMNSISDPNTGQILYQAPSDMIQNVYKHHTGGKISGRDEVLAILRGGETVRTETQEKELQQEKFKEFMKEFAPIVSGEEDGEDPYQQFFGGQKNKKAPKTPVLAEKTRFDEELIISIIADAWKFNRLGFRNVLRYE